MTAIDLAFPLVGTSVPKDHGYRLYSALCAEQPEFHNAPWLGVHPIGGRLGLDELLLSRSSSLRLRLPPDRIPTALTLAGKTLCVAGSRVTLAAPSVYALTPHSALDARVVLLKITRPATRPSDDLERDVLDNDALAQRYRHELTRQLQALAVEGAHLELCGRRTVTIKSHRLIGYSVRLRNLSEDASLRVQAAGLGGRRALGCGLFRPSKGGS